MCLAGIAIGLFIAPFWNKTRVVTAAQFITERLGYNTQKLYTYIFLFISMFTTGAFLYPVARIVEVSSGVPIQTIIIVLGLIITVYTAVGGLWAVIVTDVLQFIVLTAAVLIVVPLAIDKVGGFSSFVERAPEGHFSFVSGEYTMVFLAGMLLYHIAYIGGNWAYVQRYTSVATPAEARKVGWIFSGLYLISPVIWMLPPMIFRVVDPALEGLGDEGAYLLMCKAVLPVGMLGLMLGAMIFATSSSVNTTLNIAAGVLTNDIFKKVFKHTSERATMIFARSATAVFGILTIVVALLVPKMGGIVEVVLSLGAITGGALFLPPIWALFSKRQEGWSILGITLISLLVNIFFKFLSPALMELSLSRGQEMLLGALMPTLLLIASEIYFVASKSGMNSYQRYVSTREVEEEVRGQGPADANIHGRRVISAGIFFIGALIVILGILADFAQLLVGIMGVLIIVLALSLWPWSSTRLSFLAIKKHKS
jgi:Na+/proline symporter